jgi:hypothetical protein
MSDTPSTQSPQSQAEALLARFDTARDAFLAAFAQAPDDALPYAPAGDDYALGVLPLHLQDTMNHYLDVYTRMAAVSHSPVDMSADPAHAAQEAKQHRRLTVTKPTGADRAGMLSDLAATHQRVRDCFAALDDAEVARQADVIYSAGSDPYPTSVADILGWLTDHYDEHTEQTGQLLTHWQSESEG